MRSGERLGGAAYRQASALITAPRTAHDGDLRRSTTLYTEGQRWAIRYDRAQTPTALDNAGHVIVIADTG